MVRKKKISNFVISANQAAVYIMMRDFVNAKQCCQHALNVAAKYGALPKTVAKIYSRLATCEKEDRHFVQGKKYIQEYWNSF